jgi:hypothetical protein
VDKTRAVRFSEIRRQFPQVFHSRLWMENVNIYGQFVRFCTFPQPLLLLLDLNKILDCISFRKGSSMEIEIELTNGKNWRTRNLNGDQEIAFSNRQKTTTSAIIDGQKKSNTCG